MVLKNPHSVRPCALLRRPVMVLGAVGTGKTSACMYPYVDQLLRWRGADPDRKIGGLVLEVKGDFCGQVRAMLQRAGREADYVEIGLDSGICYNPLHNDLDPYAVAYAIATLLNNLFGKSKEPFWQQAYTDLLKFVILLRRITDGYTTFSEVYRYVLEDGQIDRDIRRLKAELANPPTVLRIRQVDHQAHCTQVPWRHWHVEDDDHVAHPYEADLEAFLAARHVGYVVQKAQGTAWTARKLQLEAVERWYVHGWSKLDARLRSSIVEGVVVFLSLFDDNPAVHRTFCPPRRAYTEEPAPGEPRPLASLTSLLESGQVLALNFPVGLNPGLARILGVMLKLDFQRAILQRIPQITAHPTRPWRDLLFVCDEYHAFATVGETDPTGDERTFALSRQARLMPIVATQSISSLTVGAARRRELAHAPPVLPHQDHPGHQRRVHRAHGGGLVRPARQAEGALQHLGVGTRRAHLAAHGPPDGRQAVAEHEQELRAPRRVHLPAACVHAAAERPGHRAAVRRRQSAAAAGTAT